MTDRLEEVRPPPEGESPHSHPHRRRRLLVTAGVLVLAALVVFGGPYVLYLRRSHPGAKSVSSAVQGFRSSTSTTGDGNRNLVGPRPGVYQAKGTGTERISFPPNSQRDGAVMPITVTTLPGNCWRWHLDYNTAHWHEYEFCPKGRDLLLEKQRNYQQWDFGITTVTNLAEYTCSPPAPIVVEGAKPGTTFQHHCTGTNTAVSGASVAQGPATIVGTEVVTIGGKRVPAIHQQRKQKISGAQQGELDENYWFAVDTGLPLKADRDYKLNTDSPIGTITYTEQGSWQLTSLTPKT